MKSTAHAANTLGERLPTPAFLAAVQAISHGGVDLHWHRSELTVVLGWSSELDVVELADEREPGDATDDELRAFLTDY